MPYIKERRIELRKMSLALNPGELNYEITTTLLSYVRQNGKSYFTMCIVMGTLVCSMFEFYRRMAAPYMDGQVQANGDLY